MDVKDDLPVVCGREGCHWHSEARGRDFGDIEVVAPQKADGNLGGGTMSAAARVKYIYRGQRLLLLLTKKLNKKTKNTDPI